jgi:spore coat protein U-like protein
MKITKTLKSILAAAALASLALGFAPTSAFAATAVTTTFGVSATVQATCIVSATAMGFGTYISTAASTAASTVTVTCTNTTPYTLGLDAGATTGATVTTRQMKNGAALLNYSLFTDSSRTLNWGNTTGTWVSGTGAGSAQVLNVYGQIPAAQYVTPGSFADTITATVTY